MNKLDFEAIWTQIKEIWPNFSGSSVQYGMCWSWFRDHEPADIIRILTSIEIAGTDFFPKEKIAEKIKELRRKRMSTAPGAGFRWIDLYMVCLEYDGQHPFIYPGRLIESVIDGRSTEEEMLHALNRGAEKLCVQYGYAKYQNFIGKENHRAALDLAEKLRDQAFHAGKLPARFYRKQKSFLGVSYETQPGEHPAEPIPEYDPDIDDGVPF